jgi:HD-GYP domain-containing protein (c-di-GMP phosphodiesterase class II)
MAETSDLRLAEPLAALSLETDLAMGHPAEEAIRACLLATGLARILGLPEDVVSEVYFTALLAHVGCTAFAHEQAALFGGDEIAVNALGSSRDLDDPREALSFMFELGRGRRPGERARIVINGISGGKRFGERLAVATCEVGAAMARRLGLPDGVQSAIHQLFERWDGAGGPAGRRGEEILQAARLAQLAHQATVHLRLGGVEAAIAVVRRRAGGAIDPDLAERFGRAAAGLVREIEAGDPWSAVLAAEPEPHRTIPETSLDEIAMAFGDAVDLKTPYLTGHARGVAKLVEEAARRIGMSGDETVALRRAAYLHDIGRAAVPNAIWEKAGPLTHAEWEQVRLHPYHTERILKRSSVLGEFATLAGMHHERLDGSGYFRQADRRSIQAPACMLAAADAYRAMTETRPYRSAFAPDAAADELSAEARRGRLDEDAVAAVLAAAGHAAPRASSRSRPGGLTEREVEVLRLVARGLTNREMARRLFISPRTAGSHIEHIYTKIGVSSRAAATLYAVENGLID